MHQPFFLIFSSLIFAASPLFTHSAFAAEKQKRPNIVFVLTDDQRWDALGCMGNPIISTPHIDRLAEQGAMFTNMFCTTSICAISRASFMLGQYERRHEIAQFNKPFTKKQLANAFPILLRKSGYRTGIIGKWGIGGKPPVDDWDYFRGYKGQGRYFEKGEKGTGKHLTSKLGEQALEFIDDCSADQPFLLQLYTKAAHCQDGDSWPFQPDPRYNDLYADVTIPYAKTATHGHFEALPKFLQTSEARNRWVIRFANPELYQKSVKDYYRLITGVDDVVGKIVAKLREKKVAENTVIIFTSDNGFYLGEHGLAGKWYMHEESIRLPLIIYDPRLPRQNRGTKLDQYALNIDIAPTILDLAGVSIPESIQGKSLMPLVQGKRIKWRDEIFYEHRFSHARIPQTEGVRTNRWKYTRYTSIDPVYEELFDLENDPHEEQNLAGVECHSEKLAEMRTRWKALSKQLE